ncbi:MAG: DUF4294 domain-containing protein [Alistipes sp.]|nr:DUF4294 domain-containing protein [Alistipes sp.]
MKSWQLIAALLLALLTTSVECSAQRRLNSRDKGFWDVTWGIDERGDSIIEVQVKPVYLYNRGIDMRKWRRLVIAVKKVYPIAQTAREKMQDMEDELSRLETKQEQREYIKGIYNEIKAEYTPVLKKMTRSQGRVLIKLIDRETEYTAYEILKEFRGGFVAGFWQTVGKIFGHDLKTGYDKDGEDKMIEQIVVYYEAGLI